MIIYLNGGLGNQIHQLSVAKGLESFVNIEVSDDKLGSSSRSLEVDKIMRSLGLELSHVACACGQTPETLRADEILISEIPCCLLTYPSEAPWMHHRSDPVAFRDALREGLELGRPIQDTLSKGVVHFRLGDYLWPPASAIFGVMGTKYYLQALLAAKECDSWVAVTDDPRAARRLHRKFFREMKPILVSSESVAEDFRSMVWADVFIAANSSLSLWAAWYRRVSDDKAVQQTLTISPTRIYREAPDRIVPGLGSNNPEYFRPFTLALLHPWVLTRRLSWSKKFWI